MDPNEALSEASGLISERGADYGGIEDNFANIAAIYNTVTGRDLTSWDVAMVHIATKLARIRQSPGKRDSYLDAINYMAFAAEMMAESQRQQTPRRNIAEILESIRDRQ